MPATITMAAALRRTHRFPLSYRRFVTLSAAVPEPPPPPPSTAAAEAATPSSAAVPEPPLPPPPSTAAAEAATPSSVAARKPLSRLKSAIRSEPDPDRIAELFESSSRLRYFHSDRFLYQLSVDKLSRARRPDLIERILHPQLSDPSAPKSEGFLLRLMSLYTSAGMPDHAIRTFNAIAASSGNRTLTDRPLCSLLTAHLKAGNFDAVVDSFHRVPKELNITPGVVPHNIVLKALCEKGDIPAARSLLDEMSHKGQADIVSYNMLLEGYLAKEDEAGFEEILKEISCKGLEANATTYKFRAAMFCRKTECFKAEELLDVMAAKKITSSIVMFKVMILGFCNEGDVGSALRIFKRLKNLKRATGSNNLNLDSEAYHMLIRGLVREGDFSSALVVCKDSLAQRLFPPFKVMKKLVEGLRKNSKLDEAKDIMERMKRALRGEALDAWKKLEGEDTYNCRIMELCQNSESTKAEELLDVMVTEGIQPNCGSLKIIIEGFCREGNPGSAMRVFERMKDMERTTGNDKLALDSDTYVVLMRGLVEKRDLGSALEVCKECLKRKLTPPFEIVKQLIGDLAGNSKVEDAKDILERMRAIVKGDDLEEWKKFEGELSLEVL